MPEIGAMLRDARMRARIDISELEAETKIRAKYLRALENEEWALLPGPAYVKSFLRTYAERLGLDSKLIVEEYKLRHEKPSEAELLPVRPARPRDRRGGRARSLPALPGWVLVAGVLILLLVVLGILGSTGGNHSSGAADTRIVTTSPTVPAATGPVGAAAPSRPRRVAFQIVPTGSVWVCLLDVRGRKLINSTVLTAGRPSKLFRGRRFSVTLGNGSVRLRINGTLRTVPQVNNAIGYEITSAGRKLLSATKRPTCA